MSFSLFTKTYDRDFDWLKLAVISVLKNYKGNDLEWTFVTENGTAAKVKEYLSNAFGIANKQLSHRVFETRELWPDLDSIPNGYLKQQLVKMHANRAMGHGTFWNWDSDVISTMKFDESDFVGHNGKQIYWYTPFNAIIDGPDREVHQGRINYVNEIFHMTHVSYEWMRCMPSPMNGDILYHGSKTPFWAECLKRAKAGDNRLSEFNIIGQFSHLFFLGAFDWRNTLEYPKTFSGPLDGNHLVSQQWSWGGIPQSAHDFVMRMI